MKCITLFANFFVANKYICVSVCVGVITNNKPSDKQLLNYY